FDDPQFDETGYAATVAKQYSAEHVVARMSASEPADVARLACIFDEPFGDSSALPSWYLMQLASKHVKVAISGDAGDELFAGYRRYVFHAREERLRQVLPGWLRRSL